LDFLRENPGEFIKLMPSKIFYLFNSNDSALTWNRSSGIVEDQPGTGIIAFALTNFYHFYMAVLAVIGLFKLVFEPPKTINLVWLGVLTSTYWTLIHLPFFGLDRFVLPLTPFLVFYASIGIKRISKANI
jgi:high-affinity Fe2+/Pb2+ permease